MVFGPSVGIVGHWFRRRRGIAIGLMSTGASVGGTVFPIVTRELIDAVGCVFVLYSHPRMLSHPADFHGR